MSLWKINLSPSDCIRGCLGFSVQRGLNHAITRLKDSRTKNIGFETPNDIAKIFNDGAKFDPGNGAIGYGYKGLEVIINPATKKIVTFRPAKNRE